MMDLEDTVDWHLEYPAFRSEPEMAELCRQMVLSSDRSFAWFGSAS